MGCLGGDGPRHHRWQGEPDANCPGRMGHGPSHQVDEWRYAQLERSCTNSASTANLVQMRASTSVEMQTLRTWKNLQRRLPEASTSILHRMVRSRPICGF